MFIFLTAVILLTFFKINNYKSQCFNFFSRDLEISLSDFQLFFSTELPLLLDINKNDTCLESVTKIYEKITLLKKKQTFSLDLFHRNLPLKERALFNQIRLVLDASQKSLKLPLGNICTIIIDDKNFSLSLYMQEALSDADKGTLLTIF